MAASDQAYRMPEFSLAFRGASTDVRSLPALAQECRGSVARTGHRHQPRDGSVLVEPIRPDVRRRDLPKTDRSNARRSAMAMACATVGQKRSLHTCVDFRDAVRSGFRRQPEGAHPPDRRSTQPDRSPDRLSVCRAMPRRQDGMQPVHTRIAQNRRAAFGRLPQDRWRGAGFGFQVRHRGFRRMPRWVKELAETRVRYGYRRIHVLLQREGSRDDGWSSAPSPGSVAADVWPKTGRKQSHRPRHGPQSHISASPSGASQDIAILERVSSQALRLRTRRATVGPSWRLAMGIFATTPRAMVGFLIAMDDYIEVVVF